MLSSTGGLPGLCSLCLFGSAGLASVFDKEVLKAVIL